MSNAKLSDFTSYKEYLLHCQLNDKIDIGLYAKETIHPTLY